VVQVLRQRNFFLLWVAGLISMTGDWVLYIALPIYVYTLTGSHMATSIAFVSELIPALLMGSVAGVYVDRWPRKRIMVLSNILLAVTLLPLLAVHSRDLVWIVYVVGFVQSTVAQFFNPAEQAVLPTLVDEELLTTANSLSALNVNVARLGGPALGGLIAASSGLMGVTLIDVATFAIAGTLTALVIMPRSPQADTEPERAAVWSDWLDGLRLVKRRGPLSVLFGAFALSGLGEGVMGTMFVIWVKQVIHGTALQLGWFMSAQAVGGIIGGLIIGAAGSRILPHRLAWPGAICFALLDMALFSYPLLLSGVWLGLVLIALVGIPAAAVRSSFTTLLQVSSPDAFRGRVFGALGTTLALAQLAGTLIAGLIGGIVGPIAMLNGFQGGSYLIAGLVLLALSSNLAVLVRSQPESPAALEA
jgi:Na+/melibiose symporter-like transporter